LHELQERVIREARLDDERWRVPQVEAAVELPPAVVPEAASVTQVVVASRKPLRVVAQFVLLQEAQRAIEADEHAAVHERSLEPARTLEAVVDELAMAAQRMPEQQHDCCCDNKQREGRE